MKNELSEIAPFLDIDGRLIAILAKYKKKLITFWYLVGKFEAGKKYSETEINGLLDEWTLFHDSATLRRELFNTHLLNRTADCCCYWRMEKLPELEKFVERCIR
jgi:hypothetical protein